MNKKIIGVLIAILGLVGLALAACGGSSPSKPTSGNPYQPGGIGSPSPSQSPKTPQEPASYWRAQGNIYANEYIATNQSAYTYDDQASPSALCSDALFPATKGTAPVNPVPATASAVTAWHTSRPSQLSVGVQVA
jgi:hypothetical protein